MGRTKRLIERAGLNLLLLYKALVSPVALGVCALVEDAAGRIVLVRHSYQSGWHLPGGGVDRGEAPAAAVIRELREELGFVRGAAPEFVGLFTRRVGLVTNVVALYRVRDAEIAFRPSWEIREIVHADPADPPPGTIASARRRLAEHLGLSPPGPWW